MSKYQRLLWDLFLSFVLGRVSVTSRSRWLGLETVKAITAIAPAGDNPAQQVLFENSRRICYSGPHDYERAKIRIGGEVWVDRERYGSDHRANRPSHRTDQWSSGPFFTLPQGSFVPAGPSADGGPAAAPLRFSSGSSAEEIRGVAERAEFAKVASSRWDGLCVVGPEWFCVGIQRFFL